MTDEHPQTSVMHPDHRQTILVVDDEQRNLLILESLLAPLGHRIVCASSGQEALDLVAKEPPDAVLLDVMRPGLDGFTVCRQLKGDEQTRLIPVIMVTALDGVADKVKAFESDADDFLTKPVNRMELNARVRSCLRIKSLNDDLECSESVLYSFAAAVEARDEYTNGHSKRVARYAVDLASCLGLSAEVVGELRRGGLIHDVGKIGVPDAVLQKPGKLSREELAVIQQHPIIGERICKPLRSLSTLLPLIRSHHEKLDGSGYPDGLWAEQIPREVRLLSVADIFDALASDRPYRNGLSLDGIHGVFDDEVAQGQLDGDLVGPARDRFADWLEIMKSGADELEVTALLR
ncbi:MAG: response regulator [Planctomycetota bacterium]|nr:response regulator [Planctomycetota bacterium]